MTIYASMYDRTLPPPTYPYLSAGLETNARPLARGELNSVRASGSSDLTSPVGEWIFFFFFFFFKDYSVLLLLFEKR